jgi:hypothetical protein
MKTNTLRGGMKGPVNEGQMGENGKGYSTTEMPAIPEVGDLNDMRSLQGEALDRPGFQTDGYINKKGTPYGEAAKFNYLPPGQDIDNQEIADIYDMKQFNLVDFRGYDGFYTNKM